MAGKRGATRLGFVLVRYGRSPLGRAELPVDAVEFVERRAKVDASELAFYGFTDRTSRYHQMQIRWHLRFRECSAVDADKLTEWRAADLETG